MIFNERNFELKKAKKGKGFNCPKCRNDKKFRLIADKLEPGIFEMKIGCRICNWISDPICEDTGYTPDMSDKMITDCIDVLKYYQNLGVTQL